MLKSLFICGTEEVIETWEERAKRMEKERKERQNCLSIIYFIKYRFSRVIGLEYVSEKFGSREETPKWRFFLYFHSSIFL